jgi:hypothetical protein
MVVVYGGKGLDDLWGLGKLSENVFDPSVDGVDGVRIAVKPIAGLSLGYALPFQLTPQPVADAFRSSIFGALYKSDLFSVALSAALKPATEKATKDAFVLQDLTKITDEDDSPFRKVGSADYDPWVRILVGIEVNPIAGLLVIVDGDIDTRKAFDDKNKAINDRNGYIRIGPFVQYSTGPLAAHVKGDITINNDGYGKDIKGKKKTVVEFKGKDAYSGKDDFSPKGHLAGGAPKTESWGDTVVGVELGAGYDITETINAYLNVGSDNVLYLIGDDKAPGNGIYAKPGVKISLGSSSIEIFDKINGIAAPAKKAAPDDISSLTNQFQIDLNWSF